MQEKKQEKRLKSVDELKALVNKNKKLKEIIAFYHPGSIDFPPYSALDILEWLYPEISDYSLRGSICDWLENAVSSKKRASYLNRKRVRNLLRVIDSYAEEKKARKIDKIRIKFITQSLETVYRSLFEKEPKETIYYLQSVRIKLRNKVVKKILENLYKFFKNVYTFSIPGYGSIKDECEKLHNTSKGAKK